MSVHSPAVELRSKFTSGGGVECVVKNIVLALGVTMFEQKVTCKNSGVCREGLTIIMRVVLKVSIAKVNMVEY